MTDPFAFLQTAKSLIGSEDLGDGAAEVAAKQALSLFRTAKDSKGVADALRCLVDLKVFTNDKDGALKIVRDEIATLELNDKLSQAMLLTVQAEVMIHMDDPVQVLALGTEARGILQELGNKVEEVNTIATSILVALCMQRNTGDAVIAANEMLSLGWQTGDRRTQGTACQCALNAYLIGGSREAVELGRRAVQLHHGLGDKEQEAASLMALANAHLHLQSPHEAQSTAQEAMSVVRELGARKMFAMCLHTLIQAMIANKQAPEAVFWGEKEIARCQESKDKKLESMIVPSVIHAHIGMGNMDAAEKRAEACLKLMLELGDRKGEFTMLKGLAEIQHERKKYAEAEASVNSALTIMRAMNDARGEKELLCMLDHICVAKGAPDEAPNRGEALSVLRELTRALEERDGERFKELTIQFDKIGGVTEEEIKEIFVPAVEKDRDGARDFVLKHIGNNPLVNAHPNANVPHAAKKPGCFFKIIERNLWYTNFKSGGLSYGPRFRCVSIPTARAGCGEAYAVLRMTSEAEAWEQELLLGGGPGIMDCNLQTGAASSYTGCN